MILFTIKVLFKHGLTALQHKNVQWLQKVNKHKLTAYNEYENDVNVQLK